MSNLASVLVSILVGGERHGWINPHLANTMMELARIAERGERQLEVSQVCGIIPHDAARNRACQYFLNDSDAEWLVMCDNDMSIYSSILAMLDAAPPEASILAPRSFVSASNESHFEVRLVWWPAEGADMTKVWVPLDAVGSGVLAVRREAFGKLTQPFFRFGYNREGACVEGEDQYFCRQAIKAGLKIFGCNMAVAHHFHTLDLNLFEPSAPAITPLQGIIGGQRGRTVTLHAGESKTFPVEVSHR